MFDDIQKPHRKHEKKTKWGEHDKFSKSQNRANKRNRANEEYKGWRTEFIDDMNANDG